VELEKQEKLKEEGAKRRQRGERLIRARPGDWRSAKIVHISRGCCQNSAEGAHCAVDALKACFYVACRTFLVCAKGCIMPHAPARFKRMASGVLALAMPWPLDFSRLLSCTGVITYSADAAF